MGVPLPRVIARAELSKCPESQLLGRRGTGREQSSRVSQVGIPGMHLHAFSVSPDPSPMNRMLLSGQC